jgi:hypothetical protein
MKREPELLQKLIDGITDYGTIANSCRVHGVSNGAFFNWCKLSKSEGGDEFRVSIGDEPMLFHEAVQMAQRQVSFEILENYRYRMLHGRDEVARFQGKTVYRRDPALDHLSDQDLADLGITTRYLRDANGQFIPEVIHHEPSVQGVLAFLAAEFPRQWGAKSTVEINQRSTGVQVVKHQFASKQSLAPVQVIAPTPPVVAIEAPIDGDTTIVDVEPDDLSDILGEAPESAESVAAIPPPAEPAAATPPPAEPAKVISSLQRDLLARLAQRPGANRAPAVVMPNVGRPEADDLDSRRVGSSFVPPSGAVKMV